ncbi:Rne/Rng family ribonuclease [Psychrobacter sp. FDAARGOS_221]|uniref:Rne/Rng family ribonuclease n=1 Tax=Psychrobacter sp. FDAARGOS_221 TaxID=1975705 RepID=UPI000BB5348E|nr:Rne/Rng family ribonuclease [Psychrobacter sp. FDAARGOS_221]PNK60282.1 ribonuclease [Psychrobacter sp. FDAARGOS_221]
MKRILINATHNEEVRVALCKGNHLYDFDLENRTREQKKANIYKGHVTRVEPSLEAVFVEYGSKRQGFLPVREIASEYLSGNPREENIRKLIKEGDELIVQVEKEERGNKGAALSTYVSLAGRYLVLMPNNPKGGGISRQISGKLREDMKRMLGNLDLPKGMSVIVRTAGIGKTQDDLQHDLNHLLNIWNAIQDQNKKYSSPRLVHQEAGVVTRAVRDYLRDDISEIWIDNEEAFIEAETFIKAVMPTQIEKLRKYTEFEPMFSSFNVERQIETAYQREVRLPSGGSIVIDQTEALVSIDINSAKSTKGADVSETAYHTNLEAADEIARQLRLRDMGGLIVIDFIDMNDNKHQKEVEKRLVEATKYDRARVQFGEISRFGLMEMSRQRLRPSLEESTGYICPRCHGNGMIRDLRSLSLSIMRQIEQTALKERHGEVQAEVPTDIAAFLLNEKRESLVYLEQDSGTRITILPHAHLESPNFNLHFNHHGFAPASYERVTDTQQQETSALGYDVDWQTAESERPEQQPVRQPRQKDNKTQSNTAQAHTPASKANKPANTTGAIANPQLPPTAAQNTATAPAAEAAKPAAVAWLSNLFAPTPQAQMASTVSSADAAQAIEAIVNTGAQSRGAFGQVAAPIVATQEQAQATTAQSNNKSADNKNDSGSDAKDDNRSDNKSSSDSDKDRRRPRNNRSRHKNDKRSKPDNRRRSPEKDDKKSDSSVDANKSTQEASSSKDLPRREPNSKRDSRGPIERGEAKQPGKSNGNDQDSRGQRHSKSDQHKSDNNKDNAAQGNDRNIDPNEVNLRVTEAEVTLKKPEVVHISLDDAKDSAKDESKAEAKTESKATTKSDAQSASEQQPAQAKSETKQDASKETAKQADVEASKQSTTSSDKADVTDSSSNKVTKSEADATAAEQKQAKPEQAVTATDAESSADNNAVQQSNEQPAAKLADSAPAQASTDANSSEATEATEATEADNDAATLSFDVSSLFADRYVAAKKFGKAANDPRVIKASLQRQISEQASATPAAEPVTAKITGSVGQFIHTHLAQPRMRLAKDGVIACFLAALNAHKETSGSQAKPAAKTSEASAAAAESLQAFSFVNYGYQSLSPSYLQRFAEMTSAVAAHNVAQGKTEVAPTPIGARAANDPRGQHPDYTPPVTSDDGEDSADDAKAKADSVEADVNATATQSESAAAQPSPAQAMADLLKLNVGNFISKVLGQEGDDMVTSGQTEAAFLKALRQPWDVLISVAQSVDTKVPEAVVDAPKAKANAVDNDSLQQSDDNDVSIEPTPLEVAAEKQEDANDTADTEAEQPQQSAGTSNKTSIETYKSMIENISEQLLPQTGLLNLTSPKVPKARSRKAKDDGKKPTSTPASDESSDSDS